MPWAERAAVQLWLRTLGSPTFTCEPSPGCSFLSTTTPCDRTALVGGSNQRDAQDAAAPNVRLEQAPWQQSSHLAVRRERRGTWVVRAIEGIQQTRVPQVFMDREQESSQVPGVCRTSGISAQGGGRRGAMRETHCGVSRYCRRRAKKTSASNDAPFTAP